MFGAVGELLLPRRCAGCGAAGDMLCAVCRDELATPPQRVFPRTAPHVPVYALGTYNGAHRGVVLAMKERAHMTVRGHVGAVLGAALDYLEARGELPPSPVLVPAPTRPSAARSRGGDPVEQVCRRAGREVAAVLSLAESVADQSALDEAGRRANLTGSVQLRGFASGPLVVVDDVVTTGATLQASVSVLLAAGMDVAACVTLCAA